MAKNSTNQGCPVMTASAGRLLTAEDKAMMQFGKKMENSRKHQTIGELDNTSQFLFDRPHYSTEGAKGVGDSPRSG